MDGFGAFLVWTWLIGMMVATVVIRLRAGVGWGRIKVMGPGGFGLEWVSIAVVSSMFWPITLAVWLARGRPEPRIVFNHKATERQRRQAAGG